MYLIHDIAVMLSLVLFQKSPTIVITFGRGENIRGEMNLWIHVESVALTY